jgi:hypothetical protein
MRKSKVYLKGNKRDNYIIVIEDSRRVYDLQITLEEALALKKLLNKKL